MSVHWMSWVWQFGPLDPQQRYVLLKLADNANQDGRCWPSLTNISLSTRLSESTVRRCVTALKKGGWLEVNRGLGRSKNSQYTLVEKVSGCNHLEEKVSQRKVSHRQIKGVTETLKGVTVTAPYIEPSLTVKKEPPVAPLPDWISALAWNGFLDMRKKLRKPLTDRGREIAISRLADFRERGHDPNAILENSTMNCWQGLFEPKENGNGSHSNGNGNGKYLSKGERGQQAYEQVVAEILAEDRGSSQAGSNDARRGHGGGVAPGLLATLGAGKS